MNKVNLPCDHCKNEFEFIVRNHKENIDELLCKKHWVKFINKYKENKGLVNNVSK